MDYQEELDNIWGQVDVDEAEEEKDSADDKTPEDEEEEPEEGETGSQSTDAETSDLPKDGTKTAEPEPDGKAKPDGTAFLTVNYLKQRRELTRQEAETYASSCCLEYSLTNTPHREIA